MLAWNNNGLKNDDDDDDDDDICIFHLFIIFIYLMQVVTISRTTNLK